MLYYIKPHNEYICAVSVDSDFDFNDWSLMGETCTHYYMNTDNIDKAYAVAKALGVSITTVNTAWEIDPCLLKYDIMYLDTLSWTVEYWDNLPVEMIDAIIATGDEYGFDLYTKAYAYMCNGVTVYNNPDIDWDAPAPELPDDECTAIVYFPVQPASIVLFHDIKLDDVELPVIEPVEVIELPQEVVSEPQEGLSTTTQINGDDVMNNNTVWLDWSISTPCLKAWELDFGTYVPVVEPEPIVELTGQASDFACHYSDGWTGQCTELTCDVLSGQCSDVLEGWIGKASELTCHISDGWYGQCCLLTERPLSVEEREAVQHKVEQFANGKKAHVKSYKRELRPTQEIETLARIKELVEQSQVPTITTKSGKVVPVSPHCITPHGNAPVSSRVTSPKVTSAIGEAEAITPNEVSTFKSTLFNLDEFDVVKQATQDLLDMFSSDEYNTLRTKYGTDIMRKAFNTLQGDIRTRIRSMINEANNIRNGIELTVVATSAPKVSTSQVNTPVATTPTITHNAMMTAIRKMNGGRIPNVPALNKLVNGYIARNHAVISATSKYIAPELLAIVEKAYAQLTAV